jgi:hypothetical protein
MFCSITLKNALIAAILLTGASLAQSSRAEAGVPPMHTPGVEGLVHQVQGYCEFWAYKCARRSGGYYTRRWRICMRNLGC